MGPSGAWTTAVIRVPGGMKILDVRRLTSGDRIVLSAQCKLRRIGFDELRFTMPASFSDFICADASPFAAALLWPAMKLGEDLVIRGSISTRLHTGMKEIIHIVSRWNIGLHPIDVIADELVPDQATPGITGAFFSGGVDSFYTYLRHKNDEHPITHLILAKGYDIDPHNPRLWDATAQSIRQVAEHERISLIEIESNVRSLTDPILSWTFTHGGCLAAAAMCLRGGIARMYIASSADAAHQALRGSHLATDHLWSTETLSFVHDGWEASRLNKIDEQIARSPLALKYLRVCYMNQRGPYNCGKCEKCLRTMVGLYAAGVLDRAETFPSEIDPSLLESLTIAGYDDAVFHQENVGALAARGLAPDLQHALGIALANAASRIAKPSAALRLRNRLDYLDHSYARGALRRIKAHATGRSF
jgi:hypothetical protein